MDIGQILTCYLLALALIPMCIAAYALSYVIESKDGDDMVREAHKMMRFCVKLAAPYFAVITLALGIALFAIK